jgi:hypothetical protein
MGKCYSTFDLASSRGVVWESATRHLIWPAAGGLYGRVLLVSDGKADVLDVVYVNM